MNLLLDTHIALWALTDDPKLSHQARTLLSSPANTIRVSVVSLWEIAIKNALRRERGTPLPFTAAEAARLFDSAGFRIVPLVETHAVAVETLDPLHGDPFDRLLVAQAMMDGLRLVTSDRVLSGYGPMVLAV